MSGGLAEFLTMGGHGLYVWLSYSAAVVVVVGNVLAVRRARHSYLREARALEQRLEGHAVAAEAPRAGSLN